MLASIESLFKKQNIFFHKNQEITVATVVDAQAGVNLTDSVLKEVVDRKTVLYLSGGSTPKSLYAKIAKEETIRPGSVGQVDERYGPRLHPTSNQLMIRDTGFTRYLEILDIPFYPILVDKERKQTAIVYDEKIRELNAIYPKSVAILGVGADGHTAGLPAQNFKFQISNFKLDNHSLATEYNDTKGMYKERVTMTYLGLEMMDLMILMVFGEDKIKALEWMFDEGKEEDIPARFYKRPGVAQKTLLITDQQI